MAFVGQYDFESKEHADDPNNKRELNEIGNSLIDNKQSVMWSIGNNSYGQHGDGTKNNVKQLTLHQWAKNLDIVKVVHGDAFCSYICSDGSLWVSGYNQDGQLGLGHTNQVITATKNDFFAKNGIAIRDVVSGNGCYHQIAITRNNELYGVGKNTHHQLGISDKSNRSQFTKLTISDNKSFKVKQIACSYQYSTFLTEDGGVYICGYSDGGGLGCGTKVTESKTIQKIAALNTQTMTQIACGTEHTLSIDDQERVWSWGKNEFGVLGHGHTNIAKEVPKKIQFFVNNNIRTIQVVCGYYHCLSLGSNHRVYAWGDNSYGQCADGTTNHVHTPKIIESLKYIEIVDIQAGSQHNVALSKDHTFYVWGSGTEFECLTGVWGSVKIPTQFHPQTNEALSTAVVLSIQPGYNATNVIVMRDPQIWARRQIAESTEYMSMVPPNLLRHLLRGEIHDTNRLTEEKKVVIQQLDKLETDNRSQKKEIESMSKEIKKLKETIEEQKNKEQSLKQQLKELEQTAQQQREHINRKRGEIAEQTRQLKEEKKSATEKTKELQRELEERDIQIDKLKTELDQLQQRFAIQDNEIRTKNEETEALRQSFSIQQEKNLSIMQQLEHMQQIGEHREKEIDRLKKETEGLQQDINGRDSDIERLRKEVDDQEKEIAAKDDEIFALNGQLSHSYTLNAVHEQKVDEERAAVNALRDRLSDMVTAADQMEIDHSDEVQRLERELRAMESKLKTTMLQFKIEALGSEAVDLVESASVVSKNLVAEDMQKVLSKVRRTTAKDETTFSSLLAWSGSYLADNYPMAPTAIVFYVSAINWADSYFSGSECGLIYQIVRYLILLLSLGYLTLMGYRTSTAMNFSEFIKAFWVNWVVFILMMMTLMALPPISCYGEEYVAIINVLGVFGLLAMALTLYAVNRDRSRDDGYVGVEVEESEGQSDIDL